MKHNPVDIIMYGIAFSIIVFILGHIGSAFIREEELSEDTKEELKIFLTGILAILSMYVGAKLKK